MLLPLLIYPHNWATKTLFNEFNKIEDVMAMRYSPFSAFVSSLLYYFALVLVYIQLNLRINYSLYPLTWYEFSNFGSRHELINMTLNTTTYDALIFHIGNDFYGNKIQKILTLSLKPAYTFPFTYYLQDMISEMAASLFATLWLW